MSRILKAAFAYFGIVFGVGFVLGLIRVSFILPILGERYAELVELPFMLITIFLAARWIVRRFQLETSGSIVSGLGAAGLLVTVEFSVVLWLRGLSISEFPAARDPVAAAAYYAAVVIFAAMPGLLAFFGREHEE